MRFTFRDAAHLVRLVVVVLIAIAAFAGLRSLMVPETFGQYGHYRGSALEENRQRPVSFAGRQACAECHDAAVEAKNAGKHVNVGCEACHGPLAKHAEDPSLKPVKPDSATLCARCHEKNSAKPRAFPQVATKDHNAGMACGDCHQPHQPKL
ncbi:MAG: hypothetical protein JNL62_05890 [Bryobacterales bacterium]|nr:hypothetical protein [Bryobacterales bacterium]